MSKKLLAHSAQKNLPAQSYKEHIEGVSRLAEENLLAMSAYAPAELSDAVINAVSWAAYYHDLGKLAFENQEVLHGIKKAPRLPICHWDAGVAYMLEEQNQTEAALFIMSHHSGLPFILEEFERPHPFRSKNPKSQKNTDTKLDEYLKMHEKEIPIKPDNGAELYLPNGLSRRLALSCLVDADHSNSAQYEKIYYATRWKERLAKLDAYIENINKESKQKTGNNEKKRNELRGCMYQICRNAKLNDPIIYCDSPVGTGKTTAIMAYFLKVAIENNLRHIIVVLPFTNIIKQSVDIYREALVLDGENPERIVAEHDHQADFSSLIERRLASLWNAPIVVTTAVQFFETLGSNHPAKLRKLHELPGSGVFIDESHSAIPIWLWPQSWNWLKLLTSQWGCHVILGSGTTSKFWEIPNFLECKQSIPSLLPLKFRQELESFEQNRVKYQFELDLNKRIPTFDSIEALISLIQSKQGPRLVIMNTVFGAAYLAKCMRAKKLDVLHLSTALTPKDRGKIIDKVKTRLDNYKNDSEWTLVATSCVEAGMNFSFHNGFIELCSVASFIQASGRVGRNGEHDNAEMYCFALNIPRIPDNPSFKTPRKVFSKMVQQRLFNSMSQTELITECMRRELQEDYNLRTKKIMEYEQTGNFPKVAESCIVIEDDTVMVVIDVGVIQELENGHIVSSNDLIKNSVRIRRKQAKYLKRIEGYEELFKWEGEGYDMDFLGYMKAILFDYIIS